MSDSTVMFKGRTIKDISDVQVVITYPDKAGYAVPLTAFQGALFLELFGFTVDSEGEINHLTDKELCEKFNIK